MTDYEGHCHCGGVRFRFRTPEPITKAMRCNCSICIRRGAAMSPDYVAVELLAQDTLAAYQFGDHAMHHYFCRVCGIFPFSNIVAQPTRYRVNLGCVDGLDPLALPVDVIDGRAW